MNPRGQDEAQAPPPRRLSEVLEELKGDAGPDGMTVLELEQALKGRGIVVLVLLMGLPFCLPVTIPGFSTPFGVAIAFIGFRLALGGRPWLPRFIQKAQINSERLGRLLNCGVKFALRVEKFAKPRWTSFWATAAGVRLLWFLIGLSAFLLSLPIPFPFTNTMPGIGIVLLAIAIMERDGLFVLCGTISMLLGAVYMAIIAYLFPAAMSKAFGFVETGYLWVKNLF
jgi:hypothetical protein